MDLVAVGHPSSSSGVTIIMLVSRCWNHEAIVQNVTVGDHQAIFDTLGGAERVDLLVWPADRRGKYTVKSGYHWIHAVNRRAPKPLLHRHPLTHGYRNASGMFWLLLKLITSCGGL
ncbi:hypothetical protein ACFX2G_041138 [Malus domestica]